MSITVNVSSTDIQNLKANLEVGKEAPASENALFNEFSNLLNEISLQLSSNAGASDLKVEAAKLKKPAKTENKEPVKEVQKKDAAPKKEASVQEAKPLPKREAVSQEAKETKDIEKDECPEKEEVQEELAVEEATPEQVVQEVIAEENQTLELLDSTFVEAKSEALPEEVEATEEDAEVVDEEVNPELSEEDPLEVAEVKVELKKDDQIEVEEEKGDVKAEENIEVKADKVVTNEEFIDEEIAAPTELKTDDKDHIAIKEKTIEAQPLESQVVNEVEEDLPIIEKNNVFFDAVQSKLSEKIVEDQVVTSEDVKASYLDAAIHVDLFQGANVQNLQSQIETVNTTPLTSEVKVTATTNSSNNGSSFGFSEKGEGVQGENSGKSVDRTRRSNILRSLGKVEAALKEIARSKDGSTIIMRLDPPELGSLKVSVSIRDGELSARIVADSAEVQQVLKEKAGELQQSLKSLGIDVKEVKVSVGSDSNRGFESMMQQQQQGRRQHVKEDNQEGVAMANSKPEVTVADHWIA